MTTGVETGGENGSLAISTAIAGASWRPNASHAIVLLIDAPDDGTAPNRSAALTDMGYINAVLFGVDAASGGAILPSYNDFFNIHGYLDQSTGQPAVIFGQDAAAVAAVDTLAQGSIVEWAASSMPEPSTVILATSGLLVLATTYGTRRRK